jgi:hypothetical protein
MYNWEYIHNVASLADMLACVGQQKRAVSIANLGADVSNLKPTPTDKLFPLSIHPFFSAAAARFYYQGARSLAYVHMRVGDWAAASSALQKKINELGSLPEAPGMGSGLLYLSTLQLFCSLRADLQSSRCGSVPSKMESFSSSLQQLERWYLLESDGRVSHSATYLFDTPSESDRPRTPAP